MVNSRLEVSYEEIGLSKLAKDLEELEKRKKELLEKKAYLTQKAKKEKEKIILKFASYGDEIKEPKKIFEIR